MPQLAEPGEGLGILHLLLDQLGHHITGVDINGADGHDLLAVTRGEVPEEVGDECVELQDLSKKVVTSCNKAVKKI